MSPAMRSNPSRRFPSPRALTWGVGLVFALAGGLILADAEARYIEFITSVDDVDVELDWVGAEPLAPGAGAQGAQDGRERLALRFEVRFTNRTKYTLWVEAINTQLYLDGQYAGAYTITEGRYEVPPGERRSVPLVAVLWEGRVALYNSAVDAQGRMQVVGRARIGIALGDTVRKVFYPVRGSFPLAAEGAPAEGEAR